MKLENPGYIADSQIFKNVRFSRTGSAGTGSRMNATRAERRYEHKWPWSSYGDMSRWSVVKPTYTFRHVSFETNTVFIHHVNIFYKA